MRVERTFGMGWIEGGMEGGMEGGGMYVESWTPGVNTGDKT